MCTFEPEKPEASVDRGARELPLSPGHDPSKTSSFLACNKRYVKCIKRLDKDIYDLVIIQEKSYTQKMARWAVSQLTRGRAPD